MRRSLFVVGPRVTEVEGDGAGEDAVFFWKNFEMPPPPPSPPRAPLVGSLTSLARASFATVSRSLSWLTPESCLRLACSARV